MSTTLPADNFNPRDNTAGSFLTAASSQLPRALRMEAREGRVCLVPVLS